MGLDALADCFLVPPSDHGIEKSIAATAVQILVAKT
jgi:hypothetical protein